MLWYYTQQFLKIKNLLKWPIYGLVLLNGLLNGGWLNVAPDTLLPYLNIWTKSIWVLIFEWNLQSVWLQKLWVICINSNVCGNTSKIFEAKSDDVSVLWKRKSTWLHMKVWFLQKLHQIVFDTNGSFRQASMSFLVAFGVSMYEHLNKRTMPILKRCERLHNYYYFCIFMRGAILARVFYFCLTFYKYYSYDFQKKGYNQLLYLKKKVI